MDFSSESVVRRCSAEKVWLKYCICKIQKQIPVLESHFIKVAWLKDERVKVTKAAGMIKSDISLLFINAMRND